MAPDQKVVLSNQDRKVACLAIWIDFGFFVFVSRALIIAGDCLVVWSSDSQCVFESLFSLTGSNQFHFYVTSAQGWYFGPHFLVPGQNCGPQVVDGCPGKWTAKMGQDQLVSGIRHWFLSAEIGCWGVADAAFLWGVGMVYSAREIVFQVFSLSKITSN